jgi:hypothetical protein
MTAIEQEDLMLPQIGRLAVLEPDAARATRHRMRCGRALAQRRRSALRTKRAMAVAARIVEALLVATFCVAYLSVVVHDVVRLFERH